MRGEKCLAGLALVAFAVVMGTSPRLLGRAAAAQGSNAGKVPTFEPDPAFPKLPDNWVLGNVAGVAIDRHDNVWMIHRPRTVAADKTPAPPVLEFDAAGKLLQSWGGEGAGYDWPDAEHNIFVDHKDNVWISGSSPGGQSKTTRSDDMMLKFTNTGKFLLELGGRSVSLGSKDPKSVNKPGDLFVSARTNEVYVADGYGNRRVAVFDADTGAFLRMWGAFGNPPEDDAGSGGRGASGGPLGVPAGRGTGRGAGRGAAPAVLDTEGPGPSKFGSPVHGIVVSNDNIVYVADRSNRRLQMFTPEGKYLGQMFVNRAGPSPDSVSGFALSPDKEQQFLYMADFGNSHIVVADRKNLAILYQFGTRGAGPGDFQGLHHIAVDSKGNLYTAEVAPGARAQRFVFKGMSQTLPPNAVPPSQLPAKQ
jgi:DNA-binding beta-propeller fold protein YncE